MRKVYVVALISRLLVRLCTRAQWPLREGLWSLRGKEEAWGVHLGPRGRADAVLVTREALGAPLGGLWM